MILCLNFEILFYLSRSIWQKQQFCKTAEKSKYHLFKNVLSEDDYAKNEIHYNLFDKYCLVCLIKACDSLLNIDK